MSVEEDIRWGTITDATESRVSYSSFFSEDVEYSLYDNVKACNDTEEPYIGKIADLWEEKSTGEKKVLIRWYFKNKELQTEAGDPREVFLAFGEGKGVQNDNDLAVICGKCRVLCTSKAAENRQPTEDDLKNADFFFSKIFDVDHKHFSPVEDMIDKLGRDTVYNKKEWITSTQESNDVLQTVVSSRNGNIEEKVNQDTLFLESSLSDSKKPKNLVAAVMQESKVDQVMLPKDEKRQLGQPVNNFKKPRILKELTWEESLAQGIKTEKVLLIQNLDSYMTSAEVQKLFKSIFQCIVDVQALPHEKSVPYGQALAIFENKKAADSAFVEMERNCLLVTTDKRPIIARRVGEPAKSLRFPGHLALDKFKQCRQHQTEDYKKAVSTSHCSQPNTIEYEMAMEWRRLYEIKQKCLQELFKGQQDELENLKNNNNNKSRPPVRE